LLESGWRAAGRPAGETGHQREEELKKAVRTLALVLVVIAVYLLHQDYWNWKKAEPLVFGFLPVGLAYHAGYSILASVMMAILVRFAWPAHLEVSESEKKVETQTQGQSS